MCCNHKTANYYSFIEIFYMGYIHRQLKSENFYMIISSQIASYNFQSITRLTFCNLSNIKIQIDNIINDIHIPFSIKHWQKNRKKLINKRTK